MAAPDWLDAFDEKSRISQRLRVSRSGLGLF